MKSKKKTFDAEKHRKDFPEEAARMDEQDAAMEVATHPSMQVLCALGSLVVHVEEYLSPNGHPFDKTAIESLMSTPGLQSWLAAMDKLAFLPKKR